MTDKLADADLENMETTRHKVKDLIKLGELKWRYRVVEEGQNPRDEAIKVLEQAEYYVLTNIGKVINQHGKPHTMLAVEKAKEEHWADELGDCFQGLALARLIFNGNNRDEDETISTMLSNALKMRMSLAKGSSLMKSAQFWSANPRSRLAEDCRACCSRVAAVPGFA